MNNEFRDLYEYDGKPGRYKLNASERQRIIANRMNGLNDDGSEKKSNDNNNDNEE